MRLAAAVEAAHPCRRLLCLREVGEEAVEDSLEALRVLALTYEAVELPAKNVPLLLSHWPYDLGDTIVWDFGLGGVSVEELPVFDRHRPLLFGMIGMAR